MENFIKFYRFLVILLEIENEITAVLKFDNAYYDVNLKEINFLNLDTKGKTMCDVDSDGKYTNITVYVDLDKHDNNEEYLTITHEIRHAYQLLAVNSPDCYEPSEITEPWEIELQDYKSATAIGYAEQEIEIDANAFTSFIAKRVFNRDVRLEYTSDLATDYFEKICDDFEDEEILFALALSGFVTTF